MRAKPLRLGTLVLAMGVTATVSCTRNGDDPDDTADTADTGDTSDSGDTGIAEGHPRVYLNPTQIARLRTNLTGGAAAAVRFQGMVDAQMGGDDVYGFEGHYAALLGVLTEDATYCDYAVSLAEEQLASEEALIAAGQRAEVAFDSYLYVGDIVGDLALTYDWCFEALTAEQRARIVTYGNQALYDVWNPDEATWGGVSYPWSGWSLSNPSNNYYYSFLRATMLFGLATAGENDQAQTWIDRFRLDKIRDELIPTFESDLQGGGSREGTGYGQSMWRLFFLYDVWEASTGERLWDQTGHTRASLPYLMHATAPTLDRLAPLGDHARESTAALFDYHRAYALVLQRLIGPADPLSQVAQTWLEDNSVPEMGHGFMYWVDFLYADPAHASRPLSDLHPVYYGPGTGHVFFRTDWTRTATWGVFVAGPYTESHAHHDQGSLLVYRDEWLGYDQNVASHSGIVQGEAAHDLVRIEHQGSVVPQREGSSMLTALRELPVLLYLAADLTPIYDGAATVARVEREVVFLKVQGAFVVMDRADTNDGAEAIWTLNTPTAPSSVAGGFRVDGTSASLAIQTLLPSSPSSTVFDWTADADMNSGYRLDLVDAGANGSARFLTVLADPDTLVSAGLVSDSTAVGAALVFTDGSTAEVRFGRDAMGASAHVAASGNVTLFDGSLGTGIDTLPLLDVP